MAPSIRVVVGLVVAGLLLASGPVAHAYEDQFSLGLAGVYGNAAGESLQAEHGGGLAVEASYGPSDIWTLRASLGALRHPGSAALTRALASAELLYLVDVFEWVPYFGGGMAGIATFTPAASELDLGLHPVFGIDFLWSRDVVVGLAARPVFVVTATDVPVYFTCGLSVSLLLDP